MVGISSQITELPYFTDRSRNVAMATDFRVKMGEIGRNTFIRRLSVPKRSGASQF